MIKQDTGIKVVLLLTVICSIGVFYPKRNVEGLGDVMLKCFFRSSSTQFAAGYSDEGFLSVEIGMMENDVIRILGEPLNKYSRDSGLVSYEYSNSPRFTHYHLRQIHFTDGNVSEIVSFYYLD